MAKGPWWDTPGRDRRLSRGIVKILLESLGTGRSGQRTENSLVVKVPGKYIEPQK